MLTIYNISETFSKILVRRCTQSKFKVVHTNTESFKLNLMSNHKITFQTIFRHHTLNFFA